MIVSLALEAWSCIMMWAKAREEVRDASVLLLKFCCMLQGREARPRSGRPDGDVLTAGYYHESRNNKNFPSRSVAISVRVANCRARQGPSK